WAAEIAPRPARARRGAIRGVIDGSIVMANPDDVRIAGSDRNCADGRTNRAFDGSPGGPGSLDIGAAPQARTAGQHRIRVIRIQDEWRDKIDTAAAGFGDARGDEV